MTGARVELTYGGRSTIDDAPIFTLTLSKGIDTSGTVTIGLSTFLNEAEWIGLLEAAKAEMKMRKGR